MSTGWENHEQSPIEFMHGKLMDLFNEFRRDKTDSTTVEINGSELNNIIAKSKRAVYKKYHKQNLGEAVLKTEMGKELSEKEYRKKQSEGIDKLINQ